MGKIKKLTETELVGGTSTNDVYPVTSTKAIYDEDNNRLDNILSTLQKVSDTSLATKDKTVVGAINEVNKLINNGYLFMGVATPSTNPGTPDQKVFYIASEAGTYANFGGYKLSNSIAIFKFEKSWDIEILPINYYTINEHKNGVDLLQNNTLVATVPNIESTLGINSVINTYLNIITDFELVNGKYITGDGDIKDSEKFSYSLPTKVSNGDLLVMWRMGSGCAALVSCDSNGNNIEVLKFNSDVSDTEPSLYYHRMSSDGYVMMSGITDSFYKFSPYISCNTLNLKELHTNYSDIKLWNTVILTNIDNNTSTGAKPANKLIMEANKKYLFRITLLDVSELSIIYSVFLQNNSNIKNIVRNVNPTIGQQFCFEIEFSSDNPDIYLYVSDYSKSIRLLVEYISADSVNYFQQPVCIDSEKGTQYELCTADSVSKIKHELSTVLSLNELSDFELVTIKNGLLLTDLTVVQGYDSIIYTIKNQNFSTLELSVVENSGLPSQTITGLLFLKGEELVTQNIIKQYPVNQSGITNLGLISIPENCTHIVICNRSSIESMVCKLSTSILDWLPKSLCLSFKVEEISYVTEKDIYLFNLKKDSVYYYRVSSESTRNLSSLFYIDPVHSNTTFWTNNVNNISYKEYDKWYSLKVENDVQVKMWQQISGNDIDGNPAKIPAKIIVDIREYPKNATNILSGRNVIDDTTHYSSSTILSSKATHELINKANTLKYMYEASIAKTNEGFDFVRIFMIDCGRKFFSVSNIKSLIDTISSNNFNSIELHFSDNEGFRFLVNDHIINVNDTSYDLSTIVGDNGGDGLNLWWSESDMDEIIEYAHNKNIEVIPAFDMPAHMGAILRLFGNNVGTSLDITEERYVNFALAVTEKYVKYFSKKNCLHYNFGFDEFNDSRVTQSIAANFYNKMAELIVTYGMRPEVFNDMLCREGHMPYINRGLKVIYWTQKENYIPLDTLKHYGYDIIKTDYSYYYLLGQNAERDTSVLTAINNINISKSQCKGLEFCVWCDDADFDGTDSGDALLPRLTPFIEKFGKVIINND